MFCKTAQVARQQDANRRKEICSFEAAEFGDCGFSLEIYLQAAALCIQSTSACQ
jgi:hypothetical protein